MMLLASQDELDTDMNQKQELQPLPYFTPDAQSRFTHNPLPTASKVIRLLTLHPGDGGAPLRASLRVETLCSELKFDALSYIWGPIEPKRLLRVDDQDFFLRPNIYSFLLRLRYPSSTRTLWLDAVCIDQNDINERGSQVSLMRDIYRYCSQCIVWLGEDNDRGDEVLEAFAQNPVDASGMTDLNNLVRLLYLRDLIDAFRKLLTNPYWTRVWMIQETTLPDQVVVCCGKSSCLLDNVPTQVRARMFELFQQNRVQYQEWLKTFKHFEATCSLLPLPAPEVESNGTGDEMFPFIVGHAKWVRGDNYFLGFRKAIGTRSRRWEPIIVAMEKINNSSFSQVHSTISLSSVSALSFSAENFDAVQAFRAIESAFWCIAETRSEQLLDERRRHSTADNRHFSPTDFRNYLETADRWYCTDVRDRVFGVLGVFGIWPQARPYRADYHLSPVEVLVSLVDYCRPTDPFKLAIRLLSALNVDSSTLVASHAIPASVTFMSRISWPLQAFHADLVSSEVNGDQYRATRLQRSDVPASVAQTFLYLTPWKDPPRPSDELASIGDASVVLGIRRSSDPASAWTCVGVAIDSESGTSLHQGETDISANLKIRQRSEIIDENGLILLDMLHDLATLSARKAVAEDQSDDGTPILWWMTLPINWFWYICRREEHRRATVDWEGAGIGDELDADDADDDRDSLDADGGELSSRS